MLKLVTIAGLVLDVKRNRLVPSLNNVFIMDLSEFPMPHEGFVVTQFLVVKDAIASAKYYAHIFGGKVLHEGGGPTIDKPDYYLEAPTPESRTFRSFLNIRVADIQQCYKDWQARGAEFLTLPQDMGAEWRAYIKDPDGYIIEVGQAKPDVSESLSNN